jgi:hypothetical protein
MLSSPRARPSSSLALATWTSWWVSTPTITRVPPPCAMLSFAIALLPDRGETVVGPTGRADSTAMGLGASLLSGHCSSGWSFFSGRGPGPTDRKLGTKPGPKRVRSGPATAGQIIAAGPKQHG